jgi:hypothetical protein
MTKVTIDILIRAAQRKWAREQEEKRKQAEKEAAEKAS